VAWPRPTQDKDKQFGMLVVTPGRTYRFYGSNKTEQQEWMTAFKAAKPEFLRRKAEAAKRAEVTAAGATACRVCVSPVLTVASDEVPTIL